VLLRYSRTAESQADVIGTQVLYDSGYDPAGHGAVFSRNSRQKTKGKNPPEFFFSDHPNPEHRVERASMKKLRSSGAFRQTTSETSAEFEAIKREVLAIACGEKAHAGSIWFPRLTPVPPSRNFAEYQGTSYVVKYPDNWKKYPDSNGGRRFRLLPKAES